MPKVSINCAQGNPATITVNASVTVNLDTIDSNYIYIKNPGGATIRITSFGPVKVDNPGQTVTKLIKYDAGIVIANNPPNIVLLSGADRTTTQGIAQEITGGANGWTENAWGSFDTNSIQQQVINLQSQVSTLQTQVATLQSQMSSLLSWQNSILTTGFQTNGYLYAGTSVIANYGNSSTQVALLTHFHNVSGSSTDPPTEPS